MGPQPLPWNSTSGLFVPSVSGSQDRGRRGAGVRGRIFRGRTPRPVRCQSEARREGNHAPAWYYSPAACWPGGGPRDARRGGGLRSVRPFDWEGLFSVPPDRGWTRVGDNPRCFQGLWLFGRLPIRPVLKHGPRSLTCARVMGLDEI